ALRRQLSADSAVPKSCSDARLQVASQRLQCEARCGIEPRSNVSQRRPEPFDLLLELLVSVNTVEQQRRVLRIRRVRIDDHCRARQRTNKPEPDALPVLVPGPRCRVYT